MCGRSARPARATTRSCSRDAGNRYLEGCDFLHAADDGLIDEFAVMVRPLSAALALAEAMKAQLAATEDGHPD